MKVLVINGPNLNLLGVREPEIYGSETLEEINGWLVEQAEAQGHALEFFQSNSEGAIIDKIQQAMGNQDGVLINPGAYTHYSIAIRDAIAGSGIPTVEVHLSDPERREEFRQISVIADVCAGRVAGKGKDGYRDGLGILSSVV